jgi:5-oxoprolinase (ATP-hydrolysing) subunit A
MTGSTQTSSPAGSGTMGKGRAIDLNADLGESYGNWTMGDDAAMLDVVTSANIACGFHAGDPRTIRRTVALAAERGVTIGAHVGYPDLVGFGRRAMDIDPEVLEADVLYQLGALSAMCSVAGTRVRYVKAHGALYHRVNADPVQAEALAAAVALFGPALMLLGAAGPLLGAAARHGLRTVGEGLTDRAYRPDGSLVPRSEPGAVHSSADAVARQALALAAVDSIGSLCLHGDTPGSVEHGKAARTALIAHGYELKPFIT